MRKRIKPDNMQDARTKVRDSHKKGFMATDVTTVPLFGSGKNSMDEMWMTTPYSYQEEPLLAHCLIQRGRILVDKTEELLIDDITFYTKDKGNGKPDLLLEDICLDQNIDPDTVFLKDAQGFDCLVSDAKDRVADCAAATSGFPHVMRYEEYMAMQKANSVFTQAALNPNLREMHSDAYSRYLDKCEAEIQSGIIPYVGEIRDVNSLNYRRMEIMGREDIKAACTAQGLEPPDDYFSL